MAASLLFMFAGLMGAAGVMLAALAAHAASGPGLESAAQMLLFHAAAVAAVTVGVEMGLLWRPLGLAAAFGFVLGVTLFSGDLALRALADARLFPRAAPTGGVVLIVSWLWVAGAAVVRMARGG
jgi:uncharacterized membrane protein YgdD (TMEM256/DUF423 family)